MALRPGSPRPSTSGVDDDLVGALLMASRALVGVAARSLAEVESDVTLQQYRALVVLSQHGELSVNGFADALAIHPSTATRLCDRLVSKGLVERAPSPESRREVVVTLSAPGEALVRSVIERRRVEIERVALALSTAERESVLGALEAFARAAGELPDHAWKLGWS